MACGGVIEPSPLFRHLFIFSIIKHHDDVIMSLMASQITCVSIACLVVCAGADQRKHQRSASLTFVRGIHRSPAGFPHKGQVMRKMFLCDDVIVTFMNITFIFGRCRSSSAVVTSDKYEYEKPNRYFYKIKNIPSEEINELSFNNPCPRSRKNQYTGEFPSQRPVTRRFDVSFDLGLNERMSKQSRRRWFETQSRSLWRHRGGRTNSHADLSRRHSGFGYICTKWLLAHQQPACSRNSSSPGQNGRQFAEDIFICILVNEKFSILIKISLKFVPKGPIDNNPALV